MVSLDNLRDTLRSTVGSAWNSEDAVEFAQQIDDAVPGGLADAFLDCTESGRSIEDCFEEKADEEQLDGSFDQVWDNAPTDLLTQLRRVQRQWDDEARESVRSIAQQNNLSELNTLCARAEYSDVSDELNLDATPSDFKDCVTQVSRAQDISNDLKQAWGTA